MQKDSKQKSSESKVYAVQDLNSISYKQNQAANQRETILFTSSPSARAHFTRTRN